MGMTMTQKILAKHAGKDLVKPGDLITCRLDRVLANDITAPPSSLSGGNQQKVVVAKMLSSDQKVLIMDEPTKGIDGGAKYSIYEIMNSLA